MQQWFSGGLCIILLLVGKAIVYLVRDVRDKWPIKFNDQTDTFYWLYTELYLKSDAKI